ncbi:MAG TPA: fibrobacter succinogenes major paralogous domain-containing protein [Bacteroidales bacterium]|nr:fibrobacter succinogenes major paralogous domain-containing protein [Bacteroidales bacterium]HPS17936.1 fibrobacter succinogenes major paralogous domain-containing protein [Bacteroidales bacterium]
MNEENSLIKRSETSLIRIGKSLAITNKLLNEFDRLSETVTEIDGNIYHTVKIGTQVWMVENLNVSHFRNGEIIPEAKTAEEWKEAGNKKQPAWCYYDNNPDNGKIYGKLFNWYAVNDSRGLAPLGWHIPSDDEWTMLTEFLGGESYAGGKMKEAGTLHWESPNYGADNSSGFTAIPGGSRNLNGLFHGIGIAGDFWSVTESNCGVWSLDIFYCLESACRKEYKDKNTGYFVRCLRDYFI